MTVMLVKPMNNEQPSKSIDGKCNSVKQIAARIISIFHLAFLGIAFSVVTYFSVDVSIKLSRMLADPRASMFPLTRHDLKIITAILWSTSGFIAILLAFGIANIRSPTELKERIISWSLFIIAGSFTLRIVLDPGPVSPQLFFVIASVTIKALVRICLFKRARHKPD